MANTDRTPNVFLDIFKKKSLGSDKKAELNEFSKKKSLGSDKKAE
jgi:hypothetical protein